MPPPCGMETYPRPPRNLHGGLFLSKQHRGHTPWPQNTKRMTTKRNSGKTLKWALFALYAFVVAAMAAATFLEKWHGTQYVADRVYGSWWFCAAWAALAAVGIAWFVRRRVRRPCTVAVHLAFALMLAGALVTHLTAKRGVVHLRMGEATGNYLVLRGDSVAERPLPFTLRLESFETAYYEGTKAPRDYTTRFTITDGDGTHRCLVSMNNICRHRGYRFYQNDYDADMKGSILSVNSDPWGIAVTYSGYALLFVALVWMLLDPRGGFRTALRSPLLRRGALALGLLLAFGASSNAAPTLPREAADSLGRLHILYNGRICPLQTFAIDFVKKVHGRASYGGLTAEQVLSGWLFWPDEWAAEPFVKVGGGELKSTLQLPGYMPLSAFFVREMGGYILGPYVEEYYRGNRDAFHKQAAEIDDRLMLAMQLRRGALLKVFPHTHGGQTDWFAPADRLSAGMTAGQQQYIKGVFALLAEEAAAGDMASVERIIGKMAAYQRQNGGRSLPSGVQVWAERAYNAFPYATVLFVVCLAMGLALLASEIVRMSSPSARGVSALRRRRVVWRVCFGVMAVAFATLTFCGALRWVASGNVPMSNGYETMLLMAWFVMLLSMVAARRFAIALALGSTMAGFFLLVSHVGQMDPAITNIMPVLNSPLLSLHVSVIMLAFALLSLTFVCGVAALGVAAAHRLRGRHGSVAEPIEGLQLLSRLLLYPALAALGIGTFVGAVWANVSWGQYWGWDAKETWALITLMVYAVAVHTGTIPALRRPLCYHAFMAASFVTILMTYFGVNYFLGSGMHTYA